MTVPVTRVRLRRKAGPGPLLLLGAALLAPLILIGSALESSGVRAFDASIYRAVRGMEGAAADAVARAFDVVGSTVGFAGLTLLIAAAFLIRRRGWDALLTLAATAGAWGLNTIAKNVYDRPRPELEALFAADGFGYPSGNATIGAALIGFAALAFLEEAKPPAAKAAILAVAIVVALLLGVTRIYAGVHYPTDIVGGYSLGLAYLTVLATIRRGVRS